MSASTSRGVIRRVARTVGFSVAAAALMLGGGGTVAWADPPPWAPAHGYRAKHIHHHYYHEPAHVHEHHYHEHHYHLHEHVHRYVHEYEHARVERPRYYHKPKVVHHEHRAALGGLVGAAAGGLLGAQVGNGRDQLAATAAGSVFGYIIGRELGRFHGPHEHY